MNNKKEQQEICLKYGAGFVPPARDSIIGIANDVDGNRWPINGVRHNPVMNTNGWYLWSGGEPRNDVDYFMPNHLFHLRQICPYVVKFLALPPGWRFQFAPGHEDVWFDESLLID